MDNGQPDDSLSADVLVALEDYRLAVVVKDAHVARRDRLAAEYFQSGDKVNTAVDAVNKARHVLDKALAADTRRSS